MCIPVIWDDFPTSINLPLSSFFSTANHEITVNATDNISVEKIKLEYKSDDSDKWSLIGEENASNGRAVFKWNTTVLDDGEYTVRAFAFDGSGNCSEEFIKKYTADNTGIGKIKIIADECTASSYFRQFHNCLPLQFYRNMFRQF